jgi:hypothetical protein
MKNWEDYVGLQPSKAFESDKHIIFYLSCEQKVSEEDGKEYPIISVKRFMLEHELFEFNKKEVGDIVESVIRKSFPLFKPEVEGGLLEDIKRHASYEVQKNTRIGGANTEFEDYVMYVGPTIYDRPIFVGELKGMYAVMPHPEIEKYGYRVCESVSSD